MFLHILLLTSFDATTFEIWGALLNGAQVFVLSRNDILEITQWVHLIQENGLSVLWLTARLFDQISLMTQLFLSH